MKRVLTAIWAISLLCAIILPVSATTVLEELENTCADMRTALFIIYAIAAILLIISILMIVSFLRARKSKRRKKNGSAAVLRVILYIVTVLVIACAVFGTYRYMQAHDLLTELNENPVVEAPPVTDPPETAPPDEPLVTDPPEVTVEDPTDPPVLPVLSPAATENSDPANWNVKWQLQVDGKSVSSYESEDTYNFTWGSAFYSLPGVPTFRGDNYRSGSAYGTATVTEETLTEIWSRDIKELNGWPGVGWTGQSLCVQWDEETKAIMNLYPEKKEKEGLVEVIVTTLDGNIYFYDLDDGSYTRDPMWIGMSFKGTATLDPRGYPILYGGTGLKNGSKIPRMYAISLIDCSILMEMNGYDSYAYRGWYAFDSSPMISGETDTLFWPGESGVLYSIKLNTQYDKEAGTLDMQPEVLVKVRYSTKLNRTIGYESSSIIVGNYMFLGDNGGMFYCIDLNTMELVWAQFVKDDVNATPVFEWGDDNRGYLYVGSSTQYTGNTAHIFKLDATSGEILWDKTIENIIYDADLSGGILSSPVLGKEGTDMEGLVYFAVAKTGKIKSGKIMALDSETGELVWEKDLSHYTWSSPVAIYTDADKGYLILGDYDGNLHLIDGATGEFLYTHYMGAPILATPIVFNNQLVVGTRGCKVKGIEIK